MVLPVMLFHQVQLLVCAVLARRYAAAPVPGPAAGPAEPQPAASLATAGELGASGAG